MIVRFGKVRYTKFFDHVTKLAIAVSFALALVDPKMKQMKFKVAIVF